MSCKISNNSLKLNCEPQQWTKTSSLDGTSVKFAGEESKDRLYEPKHKKKLIRVLTVVAYVFFVSLAAIMLSLYYVFLWNGYEKEINYHKMKSVTSESCVCPFQNGKQLNPPISTSTYEENLFITTTTTEDVVDVNTETELSTLDFNDLGRKSLLYKKLFRRKLL